MKIIAYKICSGKTNDNFRGSYERRIPMLEDEVMANINDGWQLHGNLCVTSSTEAYQVMVKYEEKL